jgi:hypothetical protein
MQSGTHFYEHTGKTHIGVQMPLSVSNLEEEQEITSQLLQIL